MESIFGCPGLFVGSEVSKRLGRGPGQGVGGRPVAGTAVTLGRWHCSCNPSPGRCPWRVSALPASESLAIVRPLSDPVTCGLPSLGRGVRIQVKVMPWVPSWRMRGSRGFLGRGGSYLIPFLLPPCLGSRGLWPSGSMSPNMSFALILEGCCDLQQRGWW